MANKIEATKYYTFTEALGKAIAQAKDCSIKYNHNAFRSIKLKDTSFFETGFGVDSNGIVLASSVKIPFEKLMFGQWEIIEDNGIE